ncbi:MAG TPA: type II toxin-antitoxin system VapC family toxin [Geminicoccaceae bacterium]|nr:type II toxin-antitoxin system VapC family toxin [Geminicoccaceae bacterium]
MVTDTSAVAAILFDEPDADRFETLIVADRTRLISAASVLESSLVVEARLGCAGQILGRAAAVQRPGFRPDRRRSLSAVTASAPAQ